MLEFMKVEDVLLTQGGRMDKAINYERKQIVSLKQEQVIGAMKEML